MSRTGSRRKTAYSSISDAPNTLSTQKPIGNWDSFSRSEYNHWYTNRKVKITWAMMPSHNSQSGIS
jgi:predicted DNA-binding transcriptional regulator AlpA